MLDIMIAPVSEKGQVTIPMPIRKRLGVNGSSLVGFRIVKGKVQLVGVEVEEKDPYTEEEWAKIEKLANQKGKTFKTAAAAKKYLRSL